MVVMKIIILLQAVSSTQAYRNYLRIYERIKLLERGKLITWRTYFLRSGSKEMLKKKNNNNNYNLLLYQ